MSFIPTGDDVPLDFPAPLECWQWDEERIVAWQLQQLNRQFAEILPRNKFYREKFETSELQFDSLAELKELPFTTKQDLVASADSSEDFISAHHTFAVPKYSRMHRTSGTTGKPLPILDTDADWAFWSRTWQHVLQAAEVTTTDRVFLAFSFGPFIGFWSAHQACIDRGALVIPGGGLSTLARLEFMRSSRATVLCCTPSYALHMAEVASQNKFDLTQLEVDRLIVAGEAGGSISEVRQHIQKLWDAEVVDHSGATEIGPWGFGWRDRPGLHVIETQFIAELIPIREHESEVGNGALRELVLTSLGRYGAPVIRYRTGDAVLAERPAAGNCRFLWLPRGVVGRADNMVTIRGVNVFPSSIDAVVREVASVAEYQVIVSSIGALDQLHIKAECDPITRATLERQLQMRLGLRIPVECAADGSLPRSELKSRRWLDTRVNPEP